MYKLLHPVNSVLTRLWPSGIPTQKKLNWDIKVQENVSLTVHKIRSSAKNKVDLGSNFLIDSQILQFWTRSCQDSWKVSGHRDPRDFCGKGISSVFWVPFNTLRINLACWSCTEDYWPLVTSVLDQGPYFLYFKPIFPSTAPCAC